MKPSPRAPRFGVPGPAVRFVLVSILALAVLFPPETRGESAAGCALLVLLLAWLTARDVDLDAAAALGLGLVLAWPLTLVSLAPGVALEPLATLLLAATAGVCAASRAHELRASRMLPAALAAVAALIALHGLYQVLHGLEAAARSVEAAPALADRDLVLARLREGRAFGAFATPAALGGFVALALPVTIGLAYGCTAGTRVLLGASALLQACALAASASASAAAALLASVAVLVLRRTAGTRALVLAGCSLVALLAGIIALRGSSLIDPTATDSPWRLRAGNVRAAAAMIVDHPWTGVGAGAYGEAYPQYRRAGDNEARHAHDLPAEWLAEYGIPLGTLLTAGFYVLFFGPILARSRPGPAWVEGTRVGLAAFAIHNLVDFTAAFPSFLLAAAVLRAACARERSPALAGGRAWLVRCAPVAVALLAGAIVARSGLAWNVRVSARNEPIAADALAARAIALAPWNPDAHMLRGESLLRSEQLHAALAAAEEALRRSPLRASAHALRGRVRVALGDVPGAFADFDEAVRLYPLRTEYARDRDALASKLPDSSRARVER